MVGCHCFPFASSTPAWFYLWRLHAALQIPGCAGDLLLQFRQLDGLVSSARFLAALLLALTALLALALAENLVERPNLRKIHIARSPPNFAIRPGIIGPKKIRNKLVRLEGQLRSEEQTSEP